MPDRWQLLLPETIDEAGPRSIRNIIESCTQYTTIDDFKATIDQFDAMILRGVELDVKLIEAADNLKIISKHGVGLDNVDIKAATEKGIFVCNTPQANSRTVAEAAISLLLATRRNVVQADRAVRNGNWTARSDWDQFCRHTIEDETLGLFGFGNIAKEVAKLALGMDMDCVTYDPYISDQEVFDGIKRVSNKGTLFKDSNTVSIHAPLNNETYHAVGFNELREIDYVINTARGEIIDENALLQALDKNLIAAGLDVLDEEPPSMDNPLLSRNDIVLTPHIGTLSVEALRKMSVRAADNIRTVYEGGVPESTVNSESL